MLYIAVIITKRMSFKAHNLILSYKLTKTVAQCLFDAAKHNTAASIGARITAKSSL